MPDDKCPVCASPLVNEACVLVVGAGTGREDTRFVDERTGTDGAFVVRHGGCTAAWA